jgi:hypothetical protein
LAQAEISRALEAEERLALEFDDFAGEWVAIRDHRVVAHAPTLRALLDGITTTKVDRILEVPEEAALSCFF